MQLFLGYTFFLLVDGSLSFDEELKPQMMQIADGDKFIAIVRDGKIVLKKIKTPTHRSDTL